MQFIKSIKLKDAACLFFSHQTLWILLTCINWTDNIFCKHQQIQWQVQWARWGMMPLSSCGTVSSKIPDNLCSGTCLLPYAGHLSFSSQLNFIVFNSPLLTACYLISSYISFRSQCTHHFLDETLPCPHPLLLLSRTHLVSSFPSSVTGLPIVCLCGAEDRSWGLIHARQAL